MRVPTWILGGLLLAAATPGSPAQVNTGTIPSKALREAALHLTGAGKRGLFGESYRVKRDVTVADLVSVAQTVIRGEWEVIREHLDSNGIDLIWGKAHFEGPNLIQVQREDDNETLTADKFLVAVGTRPALPTHIPFNETDVLSSDTLLNLKKLPKTMIGKLSKKELVAEEEARYQARKAEAG